jgi:hypothetical protein
MADGRDEAPVINFRKSFPWMELFRCFQVALDPRKLLAAGLGIVVMSLGWWLLSVIFASEKPTYNNEQYIAYAKKALGDKKPSTGTTEQFYQPEDYEIEANRIYDRELQQWKFRNDLAGPGGRLRTLPWDEYRGPNPYLLMTSLFGGDAAERSVNLSQFLTGTIPVLIEPLVKIMLPLLKFIDANADTTTRFYLFLCLVWSLSVWALFGGFITRIAALQLVGKDRVNLMETIRFTLKRYLSLLISPFVPLMLMAAITLGLAVYGMLAMIPIVGDFLLYGLLMPLVFLGGLVMAMILIGLIGYPMMYPTISTEGSDAFDAVSRSYNYVAQGIWSYLWYGFVAVVYGALVTLFVVFVASLAVYLGKWSISQAIGNEWAGRKPDFLFMHAPDSFGWRQLFLQGSPIAVEPDFPNLTDLKPGEISNPRRIVYVYKNNDAAMQYLNSLWGIEKFAAWLVAVWLAIAFMLMLGFSYSYFWTASTMIYLLMRQKIDETELDEIYYVDDFPEPPISPPASASSTSSGTPAPVTTSSEKTFSLPTVPTTPATAPPASATIPMVPPTPNAAAAPNPSVAPAPGSPQPTSATSVSPTSTASAGTSTVTESSTTKPEENNLQNQATANDQSAGSESPQAVKTVVDAREDNSTAAGTTPQQTTQSTTDRDQSSAG